MQRFSIFTLARNALLRHRDVRPQWRTSEPKSEYEVVIVGAGGHGLATAYNLASTYGVHDVAVIDSATFGAASASGSGLVASDAPNAALAALLETSRQHYAGLSRSLNFNVKFNSHGIVRLGFDDYETDTLRRTVYANRLTGIDTRLISGAQLHRLVPRLERQAAVPGPVLGATFHAGGGAAHRGAVSWAFARAADEFGTDLVENCPVTGLMIRSGRVIGVETPRGPIRAEIVAIAAGPESLPLATAAGLSLPLEVRQRQIVVLEPVRPFLKVAVSAPSLGLSIHQQETGEIVIEAIDLASSTNRSGLALTASALQAAVALLPCLGGLRVIRRFSGLIDVTPDGAPIVAATAIRGLYLNCGWGVHRFAAIPVSGMTFAALIAGHEEQASVAAFDLSRFPVGNTHAEAAVPA